MQLQKTKRHDAEEVEEERTIHHEQKGHTKETTEDHDEVVWRSCCCTADRSMFKYVATYIISTLVLLFAFYMVTSNGDNESQLAIWVSIITGIASQYMPSPIAL